MKYELRHDQELNKSIRDALEAALQAEKTCSMGQFYVQAAATEKQAREVRNDSATAHAANEAPADAKSAKEHTVSVPRFPRRAEWLKEKLAEQGWNKHCLQKHGGPEHRTTQKILDALDVQRMFFGK